MSYDLSGLPEQARADIETVLGHLDAGCASNAMGRLRKALNPPTPTLAERIATRLGWRGTGENLRLAQIVLTAAADELAKQPLVMPPSGPIILSQRDAQRAADVAFLRGQS